MFNLGDRVTTRKFSEPAVGEIVALYEPRYYFYLFERDPQNVFLDPQKILFDELYYTLKFEQSIKVASVDEIMQKLNFARDEATEYYHMLPSYRYLDMPESNLELF